VFVLQYITRPRGITSTIAIAIDPRHIYNLIYEGAKKMVGMAMVGMAMLGWIMLGGIMERWTMEGGLVGVMDGGHEWGLGRGILYCDLLLEFEM